MVASGLAFTVMVTLVKLARVELDTISIMFWRGLVAVPVSFALAFRGWRGVPKAAMGPRALRCVLGFVAMFGFYYASSGVGIGELSFLSKLQPILLAILAPLLLGQIGRAHV